MINSSNYHEASTPKPVGAAEGYSINEGANNTPMLPAKPKPHGVWLVGHAIVGLLIVLAILTPLGYSLPVYPIEFSTPISVWWGVNPKVKNSGNPEMVVPTYFFLGSVVPVVVGALLLAYIRDKSAVFIPSFSTLLHRKPRLFKHKVSYGELLFLMLVVVGNAIVFSYQYKKRFKPTGTTSDQIKAIATSLGFSSLYNLVFLALPASRHSFWMEWLNIPFANGVKYHRWLGVASIVSLVVHATFFVVYFVRTKALSTLLPCFDCDVATDGKLNWQTIFGELALLCMLIMGATSLPYVRRHYYSVFYATHFLFIPATLFAILHWGNMFYFLFTSMVLYMVNRLLSTSSITTPVTVKRAVQLSDEVVELTFECATGYNPGDAVWIKVPALSKTQWHPFSVASTPLETPGSLTIYVKTLGQWTTGLHHYVGECQAKNIQPIVYVDGGYTPTAPIPATHSDVVFIGGGIGITPLMGQLLHLLLSSPTQNAWLIWNVRRTDMFVYFQSWLRHVEALGGDRLRIQLHVTQEDVTAFDVYGDANATQAKSSAGQDGLPRSFDCHNVPVEPRPYTHANTFKRVMMLVLCFAFSSAIVGVATHGFVLATFSIARWIVLRTVYFFAVIVGCYLAYFVMRLPKAPAIVALADDAGRHDKTTLKAGDIAAHFKVQSGRADLAQVFQTVQANAAGSVAVYVCGPKSLVQSVNEHAHGKFRVHHEDFEM